MLDDRDYYTCERDFSYIESPEENEKVKYEDTYGDNLWFDFSYDSQSPHFDTAIQQLMEQHKFPGRPNNIKKNLRCILINVRRLLKSEKPSLVYHRGHGFYTKMCSKQRNSLLNKSHGKRPQRTDNRQTNPHCITKTLLPIINVLIKEEYLHGVKGFYSTRWKSRCSLLTPLEKMLRIVEDNELTTTKIEKSRLAPVIVVRNDEKENIFYPRSKVFVTMEKKLLVINDLLKHTDIRLSPETSFPPNFSPDAIELHRVFNNSNLDNGGRFYGAFWMSIPSELRSKILINGEATIELDFSGQHIGMLYAILGHQMPDELRKNPYDIKNDAIPRKLLKTMMLCALNCDGSILARQATWKSFLNKEEDYETPEELAEKKLFRSFIKTDEQFDDVVEAFLKIHPLLKEGLFKGMGTRLQRLDSDVAEYVLYEMAKMGIAVLPVHDSFIVQEKHRNALLSVMRSAYLQSLNPEIQRAYTSIKEDIDGQKIFYPFIEA